MNKLHRIMKADAASIIGEELAAELDEDLRRKRREKGDLEDGIIFKSGEEKGIEMNVEVMLDRPYGGALSISEAVSYLENLRTAEELQREIEHELSIFDAVVENVLSSEEIDDKRKALREVLMELKQLLEEDVQVNTKGALTLRGAMRMIPAGTTISVGQLFRQVSRNILLSAQVRDKGRAIDTLVAEAKSLAEQVADKPSGYQSPRPGSIRFASMVASGLNPETGKALVREPTLKEITDQGMKSIAKAIERSAARQRKASGKPAKKVSSIRAAALRSSGIDPESGEVIF